MASFTSVASPRLTAPRAAPISRANFARKVVLQRGSRAFRGVSQHSSMIQPASTFNLRTLTTLPRLGMAPKTASMRQLSTSASTHSRALTTRSPRPLSALNKTSPFVSSLSNLPLPMLAPFARAPIRLNSTVNSKPPFEKILIANRGEIACRVIRTARKMGIKTVAIYSSADADSVHVGLADEAVCVGGPRSDESYLVIDRIIEACKKTGAQAVHPGYGFLSEKMDFAKGLEDNGIVFIGPNSYAIHAMGDKIESKKIAMNAGVNVIPGKLAEISTMTEVLEQCNEIGYPVMIKASAGGGGKGMRIAWNDEEAREGFRLAKQEAMSSFKDDRILIEKYIDEPRHIEIQILADSHGNTLYLNERECSIQRRNQKVIEEAPSSFIDPATRKAMGEQAVQLAKAVKYQSAGTVEFLIDKNKNFYFLEMNTRLQVEHPVTEYITGLDLVQHMIEVAAGQALPLTQEQVQLKGWATEARVYAEDPLRNFLPSIGNLEYYREGSTQQGNVRYDSGISEGDDISIYYDPLICKTIAYGETRQQSIDRLAEALDTYVIHGVNHNVNFIRDVLMHQRYIDGKITTKFIPEEYPQGFHGHQLTTQETDQLAACVGVMAAVRQSRNGAIAVNDDFAVPADQEYKITIKDPMQHRDDIQVDLNLLQLSHEEHVASISTQTGKRTYNMFSDWPIDSFLFRAKVEELLVSLQFLKNIPHGIQVQFKGTKYNVLVQTPRQFELQKHMPPPDVVDSTRTLLAPMPGQMVAVSVAVGDHLNPGDELATMEAMKMQNVLRAQHEVVVKSINTKPGDKVDLDQVLITFRPSVAAAFNLLIQTSESNKTPEDCKAVFETFKSSCADQAELGASLVSAFANDVESQKEITRAIEALTRAVETPDASFAKQVIQNRESILDSDNVITSYHEKAKKK